MLVSVLFRLNSTVVLPLLQWDYNKALHFQYLITAGKTVDAIGLNAPLISNLFFVLLQFLDNKESHLKDSAAMEKQV